jgi:uncharacterized protein (DUF2235 family)
MAKRIIVLSDGTGNSAAKIWRTNVWRTFEALDLTSSEQVAFYDDGVGTSSFKPLAILGGAFGYGLKRNVIELYKFLCRNYKSTTEYWDLYKIDSPDDEIFAFGFSRGAFTVRVLTGLVLDQGLVKANTDAQLNSLALDAYRNYRARHFHTKTRIEEPVRKLRDWVLRRAPSASIPGVRTVSMIRFLGLWDTVAAYGLPVDEMTRGVSRYLWPLELPNHRIDPERILRACHALSLDDERTTFHPILWDESNLPPPPKPRPLPYLTSSEKVTQIWFAGVHANVGGGYPDDSLAHIPMVWIWKEAKDCGLKFKAFPTADPDAFLSAQSKRDKDGRLYDSRRGLAGYYRYGPRSVYDLCNVKSPDPLDCVSIERPKIHESVFQRLAIGAHCYAPMGLPPAYDVVKYNEDTRSHEILSTNAPFREDAEAAETRYKSQDRNVWSNVWRGRGFFLTVLASVNLAIYPLASPIPKTDEHMTRLRFISDFIRLIANPLPSVTKRWIDAYAGNPALFLISVITIGTLISLSAGLRRRITDQMRHLFAASLQRPNNLQESALTNYEWRPVGGFDFVIVFLMILAFIVGLVINPLSIQLKWLWAPLGDLLSEISKLTGFMALAALVIMFVPSSAVFSLRSSPKYKHALQSLRLRWAPIFFAASFLFLGFVFANHYVFNIRDSFGGFCTKTNAKAIKNICSEDDPEKCLVSPADDQTCKDVNGKSKPCTGRYKLVDTRELCTATGIEITPGQTYRVLVSKARGEDIRDHPEFRPADLDWRFAWIKTDLGGRTVSELGETDENGCDLALKLNPVSIKAASSVRKLCNYFLAKSLELFGIILYPLKRTFDRPFGRFVLRYGSTGNEEDPIDASKGKETLSERFSSTNDGELFVYVNKPALGFWADAFHDLNSGIAKVTVVRIR